MNIVQIEPGERKGAPAYQGGTPGDSNACGARQTAFKRGRAAPVKACGLPRDKIALVHVARRDLDMADEVYRSMLREVAGVASSADLTESGFLAVMARFQRLGFQGRPAPLGERIGMATDAQLSYIRGLWSQWLGRPDEAALTAWLGRKFHVSAIRFLDVVSAQKAIEGLKRMVERKAIAKNEGEAGNA